jgi:hypothetical protein
MRASPPTRLAINLHRFQRKCRKIGAADFLGSRLMHNKRLAAFRENPDGDWTPADFEITASQYAMKFRKATGTHVVFTHPSTHYCVAIPLKAKPRPVHVKAFLQMINQMEEFDG